MNALEYRNNDNVVIDSSLHNKNRSARAFRSKQEEKRYWILLITLLVLGLLSSYGLLVYNNPVPIDSPSFIPVAKRRMVALVAMIIAAICQSLSTVAFQSITNNRIITPSLLGFESLYSTIHTSTIFFFGVGALVNFTGIVPFIIQVIVMVMMSLILYGWLLSGKYGNLQLMLLVGIIIGTGLRSVSSFMRRLLSPSEFDILQARLFGSVNHADAAYFPIVIPIVIIVALLILAHSKNLNVLSLGKDVSTSFGVKHQSSIIYTLILVSILMSISTALIGPLTFYGFLVATLTYQAAPTYDHRYVFPMSLAIGFLIITGAYFLMYHVFNAQGVVSVIIELFGGIIFLIAVLRKRAL
ncbi:MULTISPECIES: iron chelate uptake ABC transporter family permease subunit [Paenibacillus]|uniref:Iron chelate uptake ABC transporter family permease subunit n=2 Tax=Paenibacillus TaxID=44249 RepID=A0AAJ2JTL1_9BACL|nr:MULTISPECIES: iron chelate uptake ABC transporter family permease subunit [Paenibacillus]EPY12251.1 transporter permease [Paenibacillus alvei A6-6i-x]MCY9532260.1 iron chelate uptake ABC transporter family permease subunit [Paenibacillus alvei]MDT8974750.1 iron chelate uptake ABC transporter family permease subunit [Paenibacillus sp. chi10]SDE48166.1 iron complex transport system permease protein [Paenibacillus sp. cl6col]